MIALRRDGSSPTLSMRRKVSRQEIPASMRILVPELQRIAVLPREPEANTVMRTMERRIVEKPVDRGVTSQLTEAGYLHRDLRIRSNLVTQIREFRADEPRLQPNHVSIGFVDRQQMVHGSVPAY